jgi:uncharacterized protein (TIGR02466 family)
MINSPNLFGLFPVPLLHSVLDPTLTDEEALYIEQEVVYEKNTINDISIDDRVLDREELSRIHDAVQGALDYYVDSIITPHEALKVEVTQSWLNKTNKGGGHQPHWHPNSYLSGFVILKAEEGTDTTTFINKKYRGIQVESKVPTVFNSESWVVPVKAGDIYIFPSETFHEVEATISDKVRYSLGFNTYFKGTIGTHRDKTRLTIE